MDKSAGKKFLIRQLDKAYQRQTFSCGIKLLDDYIQKQAGQDNRRHISVTYTLNDKQSNKVAGYYTLSSTTIKLKELSDKIIKKIPRYPLLPATLIGRLAIDLNYQKQGLGEILVLDALQRAYQASQEVASFAVIVDAINNKAIQFYKKYGFMHLNSHKTKLYLPMSSISQILS